MNDANSFRIDFLIRSHTPKCYKPLTLKIRRGILFFCVAVLHRVVCKLDSIFRWKHFLLKTDNIRTTSGDLKKLNKKKWNGSVSQYSSASSGDQRKSVSKIASGNKNKIIKWRNEESGKYQFETSYMDKWVLFWTRCILRSDGNLPLFSESRFHISGFSSAQWPYCTTWGLRINLLR